MCGIAGLILDPSADAGRLDAVGAMTDQLRHRGPSGRGTWIDAPAGVGLGHRRLSIIDLSDAGQQPMVSPSGRFVISFNGEVYNFRELRSELAASGFPFRGGSDTEVLLAACEAWGVPEALRRSAGMFAFALWDRECRVLHLARDRLGKKPLYVTRVAGGFTFASEPKAFRGLPGFAPAIDPGGLDAFLRKGWIGDDACIWTDTFKLPPGSHLTIDPRRIAGLSAAELRSRCTRWWRLEDVIADGQAEPVDGDASACVDALDRLLRQSVARRMVADVPLGAFLSGGVDSSVVVAHMQRLSPRPIRTFTIGFAEAQYDETAQSAAVAAHLGTDHTAIRVTAAEVMAAIPELPQVWDEPFADDSQIPMLLLARAARRDVTVALSGDGGDEAFAGYARHFLFGRIAPWLRLPSGMRRSAATCLRACSPAGWDEALEVARMPPAWRHGLRRQKLHRLADLLATDTGAQWYERATMLDPTAALRPAAEASRFGDALSEILYRDTTEYLPGDILVKVDRATMATGLECRAPLLDHDVLAFAWRLPHGLKVRDRQGKWILRQVLSRYLPERLTSGKRGFDVPVGLWMRGPLRDWADGLIDGLTRIDLAGLDPQAVRAIWSDHCRGVRDRSREVWALAMLAAWIEHWHVDARPHADQPTDVRASTPVAA